MKSVVVNGGCQDVTGFLVAPHSLVNELPALALAKTSTRGHIWEDISAVVSAESAQRRRIFEDGLVSILQYATGHLFFQEPLTFSPVRGLLRGA